MENQEQTTESNVEITTAVDTGTGDKPKEPTEIDKIHSAAKRMEKANEARAKVIQDEKEMEAKRILGGKAQAPAQEEKAKEEDPIAYSERILRGEI